MPLYIVERDLSYKNKIINRGTVSKLDFMKPKNIAILKERGVIREVKTPPLETLGGWQHRAKVLEDFEIITIMDFLEADLKPLSKTVDKDQLRKWAKELEDWIDIRP